MNQFQATAPVRRVIGGALCAAAAMVLAPLHAAAQGKGEIRIAHIHSKTGPLEAYGKQTQVGFMMAWTTPPAAR